MHPFPPLLLPIQVIPQILGSDPKAGQMLAGYVAMLVILANPKLHRISSRTRCILVQARTGNEGFGSTAKQVPPLALFGQLMNFAETTSCSPLRALVVRIRIAGLIACRFIPHSLHTASMIARNL